MDKFDHNLSTTKHSKEQTMHIISWNISIPRLFSYRWWQQLGRGRQNDEKYRYDYEWYSPTRQETDIAADSVKDIATESYEHIY